LCAHELGGRDQHLGAVEADPQLGGEHRAVGGDGQDHLSVHVGQDASRGQSPVRHTGVVELLDIAPEVSELFVGGVVQSTARDAFVDQDDGVRPARHPGEEPRNANLCCHGREREHRSTLCDAFQGQGRRRGYRGTDPQPAIDAIRDARGDQIPVEHLNCQ
jgi:hypothetical protein